MTAIEQAAVASKDARSGTVRARFVATSEDAARVLVANAHAAMSWLTACGRHGRADLLDEIAAELEDRESVILEIADAETALGMPRLRTELARTCYQLRFQAGVVREGSYLGASIEHAGETPLGPRPDIRLTKVPIGPVVVFSASNFPLAFSVAGGDTASALAAGSPVIVKGHSAHPALSTEVAAAMNAALARRGAPVGVLQLALGRDAGRALVADPGVAAVGFTGSLEGGRALFDLASRREHPIPFFGELGSVNPLVVTARAAAERRNEIAAGLCGSLTGSAGQLCTRPGVLFLPDDAAGHALLDDLVRLVREVPPAHMLTATMARTFRAQVRALAELDSVTAVHGDPGPDPTVRPVIIETSISAVAGGEHPLLHQEVFGPFAQVVRYESTEQVVEALASLPDALTGSVFSGADGDAELGPLVDALQARSGRVIFDGFPTGVAVSWGMHHGGTYPASTSAFTSVGASAIQRWLKPISFQNAPPSVLPEELRDRSAPEIPTRIDGVLVIPPDHTDLPGDREGDLVSREEATR